MVFARIFRVAASFAFSYVRCGNWVFRVEAERSVILEVSGFYEQMRKFFTPSTRFSYCFL